METLIACFYFTPGGKPTDKEKAEATRFSTRTGKKVVFRDSTAAPADPPAPCEGWLGEAPEAYRKGFPDASTFPDAPAEQTPAPRKPKG